MTGRPTFGDFLQPARQHTDAIAAPGGRLAGNHDVAEVSASLGRVIAVMARYVDDITAAYRALPPATKPVLGPWARAGLQSREALTTAARFLPSHRGRQQTRRADSELGRRLDAAAVWLSAGRDLLQTHFAVGSDGASQHRSEWAIAGTSPAATRALLAEIATMARQIAPRAADLALSASAVDWETSFWRRRLNAACQWLWVLDASVQAAQQREPVTAADRDLLCAVPVNWLPPRRVPQGGEPVADLCEGAMDSAERVRQLAWGGAERAAWSPAMTATSLHQVAAANTVTSHNCQVVLQSLAASAAERGLTGQSAELTAAANAAGRARDAWRRAAGEVDHVTTDTRRQVSWVAVEARDLATWTGRLAYAEPGWTPAAGPRRPARAPDSLVPEPEQVPLVVAAVHQANHTLTRVAQAQREEIRAAARAGRILVTTRSLPDGFDVPRPFAHAPHSRVMRLLSHYRDAAQASREATVAVASIAEASRAPSRVLTLVTAAAEASSDRPQANPEAGNHRAAPDVQRAEPLIGPVQRTLFDLGVSHPDMLQLATDLDSASERLIIKAAGEARTATRPPDDVQLNRSKGSAELVDHALASGDPRASGLIRRPRAFGREAREAEP